MWLSKSLKVIFTFSIFAVYSGALAKDFYVSPTGDNRQSGTRDQPFRTIARGLGAARNPGDTVVLREGIYRQNRTLNFGNPGAAGKPITLRAEAGEEAIIDGSECPKDASLVAIGTHHIRIEGLTVRNSQDIGIVPWGTGSRVHDIEIVNCKVHHTYGAGIYAGGPQITDPVRDILMEGNTVHHTSMKNEDRSGKNGPWGFAIGAGMSKNVTLRNNTAYENYGEAIALYLSDSGLIEGNTAFDNFAVNYYLDNVTNTRVHRNIAYSTGNPDFFRFGKPTNGIQIANEAYGRLSNPSSHNTITHNLLIGNGAAFYYGSYQKGGGLRHTLIAHNTAFGAAGALLGIDADPGHLKTRIVNNIFVQDRRAPLSNVPNKSPELVFSNNLWLGTGPPREIRSSGDVYADPQFADSESKKFEGFRLGKSSPARRAGLPLTGSKAPDLGVSSAE